MRFKLEYPVFLGLLVAVAATVVSCSKDSTSPENAVVSLGEPQLAQQRLLYLQDKYGWAGKYHTDALAHIHNKLSLGNSAASKADKCRAAIVALKEFNKSFSKDGKSKGVDDAFLENEDPCASSFSTTLQIGTSSGLSPKGAAMVRQIADLFDSGTSSATIVSKVKAIENDANENLSGVEAGAVVGAGSVAISSAQYWSANLASWRTAPSAGASASLQIPLIGRSSISLVNPAANGPRRDESAESGGGIGKADFTAFVTSLLAGWWMGGWDIEVAAIRAVIASMIAAM
jgi:hypothetical protein